jgi:hypothetical protein
MTTIEACRNNVNRIVREKSSHVTLMDHLSQSPDLAARNFHLILKLKEYFTEFHCCEVMNWMK